jgi:hypothetical protein
MKKSLLITLLLTVVTGLVLTVQPGCKKSTEAAQFLLNVSVADGVNGDPPAGQYPYDENEQVFYQYTLKNRYTNLRVELDGNEVAASGSITMDAAHTLEVTADAVPGDFLLSVATSKGVVGTPERGNFYYLQGETQDYSYSLEDGYTNLRVQLDGTDVPASGTIVFDQGHTLFVFADKYYEIRGTWTMQETYEDESAFTVTLTFGGDGFTGTVEDSDGGIGTYTTVGPVVKFNLQYPEVTYEYSGTFSAETQMSGLSKRITAGGTYEGNWIAISDSAAAAMARVFTTSGKAGKGN